MRITLRNRVASQGTYHVHVHGEYQSINIAHDRFASKHSVCLVEWYNSLSLEGAREQYAADIHGLLMSIFSVSHPYHRLVVALASTRAGSLVPRW